MASRAESGWCTTRTGASDSAFSCESVTTTAISMMRSLSGSSPVISMSNQTRLFWSCAMPFFPWPLCRMALSHNGFRSMHWFTAVFLAAIALTTPVLLLAFTLGGGLQFISEAWERVLESGGYAHGIALITSVVLISSVIDLPFALYRTFVIEARFGFNRTSLALFLADLAKQVVLGALLLVPLVFCFLWLMARTGAMWWVYAWATWVAFSLIVQFLYPTVFVRWFNKFTPLEDASLRSRIEGLLTKCGFRSRGLFVMDGSKRSSHGDASFTGFGAAKRIVLFDTLVSRLAPPEIEAVLAHELGHFARRHVWKRLALVFGASLGLLWLLGWLIGQNWFYAALGVRSRSTAMALVLFFMVVPVFSFLLQPLASVYSRLHEFEADAYAARVADPRDLVRALVKLYEDNATTLTPDPLHSAFYDSHPPAASRIARLQAQQT